MQKKIPDRWQSGLGFSLYFGSHDSYCLLTGRAVSDQHLLPAKGKAMERAFRSVSKSRRPMDAVLAIVPLPFSLQFALHFIILDKMHYTTKGIRLVDLKRREKTDNLFYRKIHFISE